MVAQNIFFGIMAAVMVISALRVVTTKNVVHAALWLVLVLAGAAGQFLLLGAEFIGVTQVLVYIGAVIVLFLFGIMLTRASIDGEANADLPNRIVPAVVGALLLVVMSVAVIDNWTDTELPDETRSAAFEVSDSIFSDYIVAFEATSVVLLAALIGAIVVARKE